jgi:hypothetical protein
MRLALVALLALALARPAFADDGLVLVPPQPRRHPSSWYAGWSLVLLGGASTLVGAGLTIRQDQAGSTTGWALAGMGTATWVAGALVLRLGERRQRRRLGPDAVY